MKTIIIALIALSGVAANAEYCGANTTTSTYLSCKLVETVGGRVTAEKEEYVGMGNDLGVLQSEYIKASIRSTYQGVQIYVKGRYENNPTSRTFDYHSIENRCNVNEEIANVTAQTVNARSQAVVANVTCRVIKNTQQE